jgi:hypothetical protein
MSVALLFATPRALIFSQIFCLTACFLLFVMVEENFSRIISMFSSANCKIKAHSAEEKFGFRAHLLSILFFPPYDMHA